MAADDDARRPPKSPAAPVLSKPASSKPALTEKEARLAAALRANLRRRKAAEEDPG